MVINAIYKVTTEQRTEQEEHKAVQLSSREEKGQHDPFRAVGFTTEQIVKPLAGG